MRSSNEDLCHALRLLPNEFKSHDGILEFIIIEASDRIEELATESNKRFETVCRLQSALDEEREMRDMLNETIENLEAEVDALKQSRTQMWRNWQAAIMEREELKKELAARETTA